MIVRNARRAAIGVYRSSSSETAVSNATVQLRVSGDPARVMPMTAAPDSAAIRALSRISCVAPVYEMMTTASPGASVAADAMCRCGSDYATVAAPSCRNLCCASAATIPEEPAP